jgi:hypothetical protein
VKEYLRRREEGRPGRTIEEREEKAVGALMRVWREKAKKMGVEFDEEGKKEAIRGIGPSTSTSTSTSASADEKTWISPVRGMPEPAEVWAAKECPVCHKELGENQDPETRHKTFCWYFQGKAPHVHDETCRDNPLCTPGHWPGPRQPRAVRRKPAQPPTGQKQRT